MTKKRILFYSAPLLVMAIFIVLMIIDYLNDPFDGLLKGRETYGHNSEGILKRVFPVMAVEILLYYVINWPWQLRWKAVRLLAGLVLFVPWGIFSMFLAMHAGGVMALHFFWLLVLVVFMAVSLVVVLLYRLYLKYLKPMKKVEGKL